MDLLRSVDPENLTFLKGKECVVVGSSPIVGRPMALELLNKDATVTVTHVHTRDLRAHVERAEVLVVAAGVANLIPGGWIQPGAVVIDVGITRLPSGKLCGDVEFASAKERASFITPGQSWLGEFPIHFV